MKRDLIIIFIIIGIIIIAGISFLLHQEPEDEITNSDINCTPAGQSADEYSFGKYIGPKKCCEGLKKIPVKDYRDGACYELFDVGTVCSKCGNNICEEWENPCNCLEDCK